MDIQSYIDSELLITVPVLYVLGMMIKKSSINDKFIPLILGVMGVVLAAAYKITATFPSSASEGASLFFSSLTQGVLCAACSVYANNIFKQLGIGKGNDTHKDSEKAD